MKIKFLTAIAVSLSLCGYAQTKGTNALSFGINVATNKSESGTASQTNTNEVKYSSFTLGYGVFIKDNSKIGLELTYGTSKNSYNNTPLGADVKSYGGNMSYQQYYPLVKTLYAYAGGKAGYTYNKYPSYYGGTQDMIGNQHSVGNQYSVGAYGGLTWFLSKRFAFETNLLSANMVYGTIKQENTAGNPYFYKSTQTSFNLTTEGFINDLGFKIFLLF